MISVTEQSGRQRCDPPVAPSDTVVRVDSLTHRYGRHVALDKVSFSLPRAETFALLGPNGGGKTTLFKILTTALTPSAGTASVAGADVVTQRIEVRRRIGVVFQQPSLDAKLTVRENLTFQGHLYGMRGASLKKRAEELLVRFDVASRVEDRVETLSGGLQRRVELAKALLHRPAVLILDEPGTGLDPGARRNLMACLQELRDQDGVTALLTTHLVDEAERCDRVGIIDEGRWIAMDRPGALKENLCSHVLSIQTAEPTVLATQVTARFAAKAEAVDGVVRILQGDGPALVPQLMQAFGKQIDRITVGKPTLADVFVALTGHGLDALRSAKKRDN